MGTSRIKDENRADTEQLVVKTSKTEQERKKKNAKETSNPKEEVLFIKEIYIR